MGYGLKNKVYKAGSNPNFLYFFWLIGYLGYWPKNPTWLKAKVLFLLLLLRLSSGSKLMLSHHLTVLESHQPEVLSISLFVDDSYEDFWSWLHQKESIRYIDASNLYQTIVMSADVTQSSLCIALDLGNPVLLHISYRKSRELSKVPVLNSI